MRRWWVGLMLLLLMMIVIQGAAGCFRAEVAVQLIKGSTLAPYAIDKMRVYLEFEGGETVSRLTNTAGRAVFRVSQAGTYRVIRVEGLDVTGGDEGDEGREFIKASPLSSPVPLLVHQFSTCPSAMIVNKNESVEIQCPLPLVRKTTIIRVAHVDTPDEASYLCTISPSFAGRAVVKNVDCDCNGGLFFRSSGTAANFLVFTLDIAGSQIGVSFYSNYISSFNIDNAGDMGATVTLEIPGNGDWAFRVGTTDNARKDHGGAGTTRDFTSFGNDSSHNVLDTYNYGINRIPPDHYRFDYEIQEFEDLL